MVANCIAQPGFAALAEKLCLLGFLVKYLPPRGASFKWQGEEAGQRRRRNVEKKVQGRQKDASYKRSKVKKKMQGTEEAGHFGPMVMVGPKTLKSNELMNE